jgi:hypothetical protein
MSGPKPLSLPVDAPLSPNNQGAVLTRADVVIGRLHELRRRNAGNQPVIHLLDTDDLGALRHATGLVLALLAIGAESELSPRVEEELRDVLVALVPLMQAVAAHLEEKHT